MPFWSFWWLIFPVMFFATGALRMWLRYRRHKDTLELMKIYAAQGKDPAEVARMMGLREYGFRSYPGMASADTLDPPPPPEWVDPAPDWGSRRYRRWSRRWDPDVYRRFGPYRLWRQVIFSGSVAIGFWLASRYSGIEGAAPAFRLVAIITGVVAVGSLLSAIVASIITADAGKSGQ